MMALARRFRFQVLPYARRHRLALQLALNVILLLPPVLARGASLDEWVALPEDQEIALGREMAQQVQAKLPMLYAAGIVSYVNRLGQRLARESARPKLAYTFRVLDVAEVNAFTLPGGFILVERGLLDVVSTEAELAAVLAHEVGHAAARHAAKQAGRLRVLEAGAGILAEALGGGQSQGGGQGQAQGEQPSLAQVAFNLLATGVLLKYSREQENEADALGFTEMVKAGYDPRGLITFLQTLLARRRDNPNAPAQLFATHPPSEERIQALSARWWAERPPGGLIVDSPEFRTMKADLATLPPAHPVPNDPLQSPKQY